MALEVYYPQDIRNALLAAENATGRALEVSGDGEYQQGYQDGFRTALATIALAFGLLKPGGDVRLIYPLGRVIGGT